MKRMTKALGWSLATAYFAACFFVLMSIKALAYVDATSVTYVIQAVVGIFVAIGAVITVQRHKIVAAWRKWYYGRMAKKNAQQQLDNMNSTEEK